MTSARKILTFVGSRANYSSIKSVMRAIVSTPGLELITVAGASAMLDRFGRVIDLVRRDGFEVHATFHMLIEGENPTTMAKSTGLGLIEMATILDNLRPDFVLVVGDRFEIASVALAAAYMNIPIAHTMGGEITGTIDESVRRAVTKLAHVHFPANAESAERIVRMGEPRDSVFLVGCPRIDLVKEILSDGELPVDFFAQYRGVGPELDLDQPFLLVESASCHDRIQRHPPADRGDVVGRRFTRNADDHALAEFRRGLGRIAKGIRTFRERHAPHWLHLFINLPPDIYIRLMNRTACLVGNSSSAIREGRSSVSRPSTLARASGRDSAEATSRTCRMTDRRLPPRLPLRCGTASTSRRLFTAMDAPGSGSPTCCRRWTSRFRNG